MEENQNPPPQPPVENPAIVKSDQKPSNFKSKLPFLIIAVLLVLVGIFGGYFVMNQVNKSAVAPTPTPQDNSKACTQEARICPDGSSVGRSGPKCEFAACPASISGSSAETADWKTYTGDGFTFKYPGNWTLTSLQSKISLVPANKILKNNGTIYMISYDNPNNLTLQDWNKIEDENNDRGSYYYTSDTKKGGYPNINSYVNEKGMCEPFYCKQVIFMGKNKVYIFNNPSYTLADGTTSGYTKEEIDSYKPIFDQILSTFKFTQ